MVYVLVLISVAAMTAAQLLLKKGLLVVGHFPQNVGETPHFFLKAYTNPYVIGAVFLTIVTAMAWLLAVSKADLSHIYPFMALSYVLVAVFSWWIFKEDISALRWLGIAVICFGVILVSRT
jgi:drug/metabolite transporter (DMT)-like permease